MGGDAVLGGSDEGALKDIHTYDPAADQWTLWASMPDGRYYATSPSCPTAARSSPADSRTCSAG